jgi:CheY-like chemotaxis protein
VNAKMLVLTADPGLCELLRPQVENQGCDCYVAESYDEAAQLLGRAEALLVDLELPGGGLDAIRRLLVEAPELRIVAIATNAADASAAEAIGVQRVLQEPLSIADVVDAVRSAAAPTAGAEVIELRTPVTDTAGVLSFEDDLPWWATR